MKRISTILLVLALILTLAMAAGCDADVTNSTTGSATLIISADEQEPTTYTVNISELSDSTGIALLEYLVATQELHLVTSDSGYGAYITEIGTLVGADDYSTWIALYTSIEGEKDTSTYCTTLVIDGVTVYSSGLGISSMSVTAGCTIYITLGSY